MSKRRNLRAVDNNQKTMRDFFPSSPNSRRATLDEESASTSTSPAKSVMTTPPRANGTAQSKIPSARKKLRLSEDDAECSDDSTTSSYDSPTPDMTKESVQATAIYKIIFERFNKRLQAQVPSTSKESQLTPEERIIDTIVREYNEKPRRKSGQSEENETFHEINTKPIALPTNLQQLLRRDPFNVKLFVKETFSQHYILKWNDSALRNCNIHIVWFFYRPKEIFALTTNQGWNVVHQYSDFHFPLKVASRLCSKEGPTKTDDQVLIGDVKKSVKVSQIGRGKHIDDIPVLCRSFTAQLRSDASILEIPCFRPDQLKSTGRTCIEFGLSSVRFKRRFQVEHIPLVLDHLSIISRGEKTEKFQESSHEMSEFASAGGPSQYSVIAKSSFYVRTQVIPGTLPRPEHVSDAEISFREEHFSDLYQFSQEISEMEEPPVPIPVNEELDAAIYRRNVSQVPPEFALELDQHLAVDIFKGLQSGKMGIGSYYLSWKSSPETFNLLTDLYYNKTNLGELPVHATLKDAFDKIRPQVMDKSNAIEEICKNFWIKPRQVGRARRKKWFDLIEAEIFYKGQIFWRVVNTTCFNWCSIHPAYIFSSHAWFNEFLQTNLVTDETEKHLKLPWINQTGPRRLSVEAITNVNQHYVLQYKDKDGFYLPPAEKQYLFDIIFFDRRNKPTPQINIYFVSSNFNSQTAEIALRVLRCMEEISLARKQKPSGYFYDWYRSEFSGDFDEKSFLEIISESNFIYALAHVPDPLTGEDIITQGDSTNLTQWLKRSFKKERGTSRAITKNYLQKFLIRPDCPLSIPEMAEILRIASTAYPEEHEFSQDRNIYSQMAAFILEGLMREGYVKIHSPTLKFLYTNVYNFSLGLAPCGRAEEFTRKIFSIVSYFQPKYASLRTTFELKNVATRQFLRTKFKIYEI